MDHGSDLVGTTNGYGLTWLSVRLIEQGIRLHLRTSRTSQTQGKVERFHSHVERSAASSRYPRDGAVARSA